MCLQLLSFLSNAFETAPLTTECGFDVRLRFRFMIPCGFLLIGCTSRPQNPVECFPFVTPALSTWPPPVPPLHPITAGAPTPCPEAAVFSRHRASSFLACSPPPLFHKKPVGGCRYDPLHVVLLVQPPSLGPCNPSLERSFFFLGFFPGLPFSLFFPESFMWPLSPQHFALRRRGRRCFFYVFCPSVGWQSVFPP